MTPRPQDGVMAEPAPAPAAATATVDSPSWKDVQEHAQRAFKQAKVADDRIALAWQIPAPQGSVLQWVRISPVTIRGATWLTILAEIGPEALLSPASALSYLNQLSVGGIMLWRGVYLLRQMVPLAHFDLQGLEGLVRLLAHEALRLRMGISRGQATLDAQLSQMFEE